MRGHPADANKPQGKQLDLWPGDEGFVHPQAELLKKQVVYVISVPKADYPYVETKEKS